MENTIAQTILAQLGGKRFLAMTGAKNLLAGEDYLAMSLPGSLTKGRVNKIRIRLAADDTYTLYTSSQNPHGVRFEMSQLLHVAENQTPRPT